MAKKIVKELTAELTCALVKQWQDAFGVKPNIELQLNLVAEEVNEFYEALGRTPMNGPNAAEILKEAADVYFTFAGLLLQIEEAGIDHEDSLDQTIERRAFFEDLNARLEQFMDFMHGIKGKVPTFPEMVYDAFHKVFESNMSKLDDDGLPVRDENGKIMKGANYVKPDLSEAGAQLFLALKAANEAQAQKAEAKAA